MHHLPLASFRVPADRASSSRGRADAGITWSTRTEYALLDWMIANGPLCALRLNGSVHASLLVRHIVI